MTNELIVTIPVKDWPRTGSKGNGSKVSCPACGATGYATYNHPAERNHWSAKHFAPHVRCPDCDKIVTAQGLGAHRRIH